MINKPSQLTSVRTQIQKERLFKSALTRGDGNAIIAVILYLKQTMSKSFDQQSLQLYLNTILIDNNSAQLFDTGM
ncbi:hypothetical protein ACOME3_003873 [Neoechinorhynchus agilis]